LGETAMKDRIAKSIFWVVWSRGIFQTLSFATTLIVARWLNPSDYGLMALAGAFVAILGLICELGLGAAVVQFPDLQQSELNFCFYLAMISSLALYVVLFFGAPGIAVWFETPALVNVLRIAALVLPIAALGIVPDGLLQKRLELDRVSKAEMSGGLLSLVIVLTMAWMGMGVWALIGGSLARAIVRVAVLYRYVPWWPGVRIGSTRMRKILYFSFGIVGSNTLWVTYDQSDNFVLGKVAGDVSLGFYTMARDLAIIPVTRISSVVNQLSGPLMASLQDDVATMRKVLLRGIRLTASVSVPICVGLALVADDFVGIALSSKWTPIVPILQILCATSVIKSIDVLIAPVLRARYRTNFLAVYNFALLVLMPVAFVIGATLDGGIGVALAWLIAYPLVMSRMAVEAFREIGLGWRTVLAQLRGPILAAAGMTLAVVGLRVAVVGADWKIVLGRLIAECTIGAIVYAGLLWHLGGPLRDELHEVMSWLFKLRSGTTR